MDNFSFEVTTDLTVMNPTQIESNYQECKAWLTAALEPYMSLVVAEDAIAEAKTVRANIRKVKDAINAQKISVTKQWNKPLDLYLAQCKELMSMCDDAANGIDNQVKAYEARAAEEKLNALRNEYTSAIHSLNIESYAPDFESICDPRWKNKGYAIEKATAEIVGICTKIANDIQTLRRMNLDFEEAVLDQYCRTRDLGKALDKENALRALREAQEVKANVVTPPPTENASGAPLNLPHEDFAPVVPTFSPLRRLDEEIPQEKLYTYRFELTGTKTQMIALRKFFDESEIAYKKI